VVPSGPTGFSDFAQDVVLVRRVRRRKVGEGGKQRITFSAQAGVAIAELAALGGELGQVLTLLRRGRAAAIAARAILLCLQAFELGGDLAPPLVELEQTIDRVPQRRVSPGEGALDRVRVAADQPDVENLGPPPERSTAAIATCPMASP
jgi:hypothetical protein